MHSCLTIAEVQYAIFRDVQSECHGSVSLARLARTCRTFNNVALDILWETLPSIRYLIQCLPTDLWKISKNRSNNREIIFQRTMIDSDWEIFSRFSSRIRSLSSALDNRSHSIVDLRLDPLSLHMDTIIALSQSPSNSPLIPKLKSLRWTDSDTKYVPLLQSLLTCSLVDVSLPSFVLRSPEMSMDLITRCVSLKNLSVLGVLGEGHVIPSETLTHLCSLELFECYTLDEVVIRNLSRSPSLVKLSGHLQNNLQLKKMRTCLIPPTFPSLESLTLDLGKNSLSTLTSILDGLRFNPREMSFSLDIPPTPDMLHSFFSALVNACGSKQLSHISLTMSCDQNGQDGYRPRISLITFEPLLALPNVKSFTLDVPCDIHLNNDDINALTRRWLKLTKLFLNGVRRDAPETDYTVNSLHVAH